MLSIKLIIGRNIKIKKQIISLTFLLNTFVFAGSLLAALPLVYDVENTGAGCPDPPFPVLADMPVIEYLPDPFLWADTSLGRIDSVGDWRCRRAEIGALFENYEVGFKPEAPETLDASFINDTLQVDIVKNGISLTLKASVSLPAGTGPFPALIGAGMFGPGSLPLDIFTDRGIAVIHYDEVQVANAWTSNREGVFFDIYPGKQKGKFIAFAWGASRIIDGLELCPEANIDLAHIAITGCSYAGKIALFSGAFDERIALTLVQESGGGGDATWRFSETLPDGTVENLERAQGYAWYRQDLSQFNSAVTKLPVDHHELMGMVAPRALLIIGNPDMVWMAEESGHVGCKAAQMIYEALGIEDRFGFSKVGHGDHCVLPTSQRPEIIAFVEKFLLGNDTVNTYNIEITPYSTDLTPWIPWDVPFLEGGIEESSSIGDFDLMQNYPNPFYSLTNVNYYLKQGSHVELSVYDIAGKKIKTLLNEQQNAGNQTLTFDGAELPSGIYICTLKAGRFTKSKKMLLLH